MTRTALRSLVVFVLASAAGAAWVKPAAAEGDAPGSGAPAAKIETRGVMRALAVEPAGLPKKISKEYALAAQGYNDDRGAAESRERKKGKSPREIDEAVRHDPAVSAKLSALGRVVADPTVPSSVREPVAANLNSAGRFQEAAALSAKTLAAEPDNRDALNNIAQARYSLGQYRESIEAATRAMQQDPSNEAAYTTRALSRYYSGDYLEAADDARRALALDKDNDIALATLRMAENHRHPPRLGLGAIEATQAANIKAEYQSFLEQRNQVEAESARVAAAGSPAIAPEPLGRQAAAAIAANDHWGAIADATKAIAAHPGDAEGWYLRATAHNLAGEHERAESDAGEAIRLAPGRAPAYDARAQARLALGHWTEAAQDASQSIRIDPADAYAFAIRARAFEKLGDFAAMLKDFQRAARLNPQFEPEYRQEAAVHALPPPEIAPEPAKAPAPAPARGAEGGKQRLWFLMASTLLGGCLIALGLLQVLSAQWNRKLTTAIKRLEQRAPPVAPPPGGEAPGVLPSQFQLVRTIGKGGMGVVYEALDKGLNRRVALKKMREEIRVDPRERARFLEEARTVAGLHHLNIVEIYAIVEEGDELCLVFEHVRGRTVEELLAAKGRLPLAQARHIARGACRALDYAHGRGVVHRDLKPSNIMLTDDKEVKVMDFGIARHVKDALSGRAVTNTVAGTPSYMAPEADEGIVRPESDVYSLGSCLYEMLTGAPPFLGPAAPAAKQAMRFERPSRLRGELGPAADALIEGALQPDPDRRIRTPAQFLAQLEAAFSVPA